MDLQRVEMTEHNRRACVDLCSLPCAVDSASDCIAVNHDKMTELGEAALWDHEPAAFLEVEILA